MNPSSSSEHPGVPVLKLAGLQLWIHGRADPQSDDYYDGNWLRASAHCGGAGASIRVQGSILLVMDIERFGAQCEELREGNCDTATLDPCEPDLHVVLQAIDRLGGLRARVEITPDHLTQSHRMDFTLDQSYLPEIIRSCKAIVAEYPIRGRPPRDGD